MGDIDKIATAGGDLVDPSHPFPVEIEGIPLLTAGSAIDGSAMPAGGDGLLGWLSAIYTRLLATLKVSQQAQTSHTVQLIPTGSALAQAYTQQSVDGYNGVQMIRLLNTGSGTCNVLIEGSYTGSNWFTVGYQRVDGQVLPQRAASAIALGAAASGTDKQVLQILDFYPILRATISGIAGAVVVDGLLCAVPE